MSVYLSKKSPYFRFDFELQGQRHHGSTKVTTRCDAEKFEEGERARVSEARRAVAAPMPLIVGDVARRYWENVGRYEIHAQRIWNDLERVVKYLDKPGVKMLLSDISDIDVTKMVDRRWTQRGIGGRNRQGKESASISASTIHDSIIDPLEKLFAHAKEAGAKFDHEPNWLNYGMANLQQRVCELAQNKTAQLAATKARSSRRTSGSTSDVVVNSFQVLLIELAAQRALAKLNERR